VRHADQWIKSVRGCTGWPSFGIALALVVLLIWGCGGTPHAPNGPDTPTGIHRVLVLPFKKVSPAQKGETGVRCPLSGAVFSTGEVIPGATRTMTRHLLKFLKERTEYQLIPPEQAEGIRSQILSKDIGAQERSMLIEIGRTLGVDAVLVGHIYRYRERIGTAYSVDTPTSVALDLHFIRVADGTFIWHGRFDETQTSLSEDCLKIFSFIQRGGKWLTADELAGAGLEEVLDTFPTR